MMAQKTKYTGRGAGPDGINYPGSTGIKVIIIGLGYAGAAAAIECHLKGHQVVIYEQQAGVSTLGKLHFEARVTSQMTMNWQVI